VEGKKYSDQVVPLPMKHVVCNFCGSDQPEPVYVLRDVRLGIPGEYPLVKCLKCGLLYLNPQPESKDLDEHYPPEYHCYNQAIEDQTSGFVRWAHGTGLQRRCRVIQKRRPGGSLLDVGCATGLFLNAMRDFGQWNLTGIELSHSAAEYARQRFGLNVVEGSLEKGQFEPECFDIITLWDVLEHLDNPLEALRQVYRLLKPGGWILIKTPDPSGWDAKLFGGSWIGYEAPQHLYSFPKQLLARNLTDLGFSRIESFILGTDYSSYMMSLSTALKSSGAALLAELARTMSRSSIARVAASPIFLPLRHLGFNSSVSLIAQKTQGPQ
jgi:2-polyprenyl-3-methyl-5-hydroxy-6-metoxy-1,4-benzoquinol methylase